MTLKDKIKTFVSQAIEEIYGTRTDMIPVEYPDQKQHGDYATTAAMPLAKLLKKNPREIAAGMLFLACDAASYITGQTIYACGGITLHAEFKENWAS